MPETLIDANYTSVRFIPGKPNGKEKLEINGRVIAYKNKNEVIQAFKNIFDVIESRCRSDLQKLKDACHINPITTGLNNLPTVSDGTLFSIDKNIDLKPLNKALFGNESMDYEDQFFLGNVLKEIVEARIKQEKGGVQKLVVNKPASR